MSDRRRCAVLRSGALKNVFERIGDLALMLRGCDASDISMKMRFDNAAKRSPENVV